MLRDVSTWDERYWYESEEAKEEVSDREVHKSKLILLTSIYWKMVFRFTKIVNLIKIPDFRLAIWDNVLNKCSQASCLTVISNIRTYIGT